MTDSPLSEVRNADWQFQVERTYVLALEIFDRRLSPSEKELLFLLRYRASGGETNFVSYATLAEDLGVHESSIKKRMKKLKEFGYVTCSSRGFSASTIKTISSMVERYDKEVLLASRKEIVGSGRTPEMLNKLHGVTPKLLESSEVPKTVPMDESDSHRYPNGSPISTQMGTSQVPKTVPKVDKEKIDQNEIDSDSFGICDVHPSGEHPSETVSFGDSKGSQDKETEKAKGEIRATPDSRPSVEELQGVAEDAWGNAVARSRRALERRRAKQEAKEASGEADAEKAAKARQRLANKTEKAKLQDYMRDTYGDWFPGAKLGKFNKVDWAKINTLIRTYDDDYEFIKRAWGYICENWDEVKQRLKIDSSVPTIGIFVGFRESIFALVQDVKTKRQEQESNNKGDTFEW